MRVIDASNFEFGYPEKDFHNSKIKIESDCLLTCFGKLTGMVRILGFIVYVRRLGCTSVPECGLHMFMQV